MTLSLPPSDRPRRAPVALHRTRPLSPVTGGDYRGGDPADEPVDWRRVWSAIVRWRWLVIGLTIAGGIGGVAATMLIDPLYRAQATIWIDSRDRASGPAPFQPGRLLDPEAWLDLVRSYAVLDEVARAERLYLRTEQPLATGPLATFQVADSFRPGDYVLTSTDNGSIYVLSSADGTEIDRGAAGAPLGLGLGFVWTPAAGMLEEGEQLSFEVTALRDASDQLAEALQLHIDPDGNLLRMELEGADRGKLASVLDRVASRYVEVAGELKLRKLTELTGILEEQLASATRDLVSAESTYQVFRTGTITLPGERPATVAATPAGGGPGTADPVSERYFSLVGTRASLHRDRAAIERALGGEGGALSIEALNSVAAARESRALGPALEDLAAKETELRGLRSRYSDIHPSVIQLSQQVATLRERTIPELARALAEELRVRERGVGGEVAAAATDLRRIPARTLQEGRLRRTVALAEDLHNTLQQRHEEARLAVASTLPDARVLDRADVPRYPVQDSAPRIVALALLGSLALGLAAAVALDRFDPKFRYPSQVSRELGLPILGAIPHLPGGRDRSNRPVGPLIEALRGVRMSVAVAAGDATPLTLAISSPGSGDGKSFVTSHLAFTFAEAGFRTLLIDGDIRRGHLHQRFNLERRPGLSDVLQDHRKLSEALHPSGYPGLSVLPCGARAHFAPELLGGASMTELMDELRGRFDVILCDTPPLTAGIDPFVLAGVTGRMLLVLRNGFSHRETMSAKLAVLGRLPIELLGVVMNDVGTDAAYGYYSYYLPGYEARDEGNPDEIVTVAS
jgi:capsular exopolysaccharide synthesis family protein